MTNANKYDVIIIGAGHNGLTCAATLAKRGRKVLVLERRDVVGGLAVGDVFHEGCRAVGLFHETSYVRPAVVDALALSRFGLELLPDSPTIFAPELNGRGLLLGSGVSELGGADRERFPEYLAFLSRLTKFTRRLVDNLPPDILANGSGNMMELLSSGIAFRRLGRDDMLELLRVAPMSLADWLGEWFESELLQSLLAAPALMGTTSGPRSPGGVGNLIRCESLTGRSVRGGAAALIAALEAAAKSYGAEIRTGCDVSSIRLSGGRVEGVTLANDDTLDASIVASSCDAKTTFLNLVGGRQIEPVFQEHLEHIRMRGTTAKVNLALSSPLRFSCRSDLQVARARIGETLIDLEKAHDAVKYQQFSEVPMLDVYCPAAEDQSGAAVVSIIAHFVPYELDGGWSDAKREQLGDAVVESLARYAPEVKSSIVGREVLSPADIEQRFGATGGHIHHGEHALDQLMVRPTSECARYATPIAGLFLCGSGSHPGGDLTCAPGSLAAAVIAKSAS